MTIKVFVKKKILCFIRILWTQTMLPIIVKCMKYDTCEMMLGILSYISFPYSLSLIILVFCLMFTSVNFRFWSNSIWPLGSFILIFSYWCSNLKMQIVVKYYATDCLQNKLNSYQFPPNFNYLKTVL